MLKIGLSARILAHSPMELGCGGKSIQYLEQNMANAFARAGGLVFLIPSIGTSTELSQELFRPRDYALALDALVLQGGVDVSPAIYGEEPLHAGIVFDRLRDEYEIALIDAFVRLGKPVLGICRGMQLINIYFGGTLVQDIPSQLKSRVMHFCDRNRERVEHAVEILGGGYLARLYGSTPTIVNSIHHQCIKRLGKGLKVEAVCPEDGLIEAVKHTGDSYIVGVQWHPELHTSDRAHLFDPETLFRDFMSEAAKASARTPELRVV